MAQIKTTDSFSGGHCHPGSTPNTPTLRGARINGNVILRFDVDSFPTTSCGDTTHVRVTATANKPNLRINGLPVFTSDDFLSCGEPAGAGNYPVFC